MSNNHFAPLAATIGASQESLPQPQPPQADEQSPSRAASASTPTPAPRNEHARRRKGHRGGKKKRSRRKSFATGILPGAPLEEALQANRLSSTRDTFYGLHGGNLSGTSIDSETLLDHRDQQPLRPRRASTMAHTAFAPAFAQSSNRLRVTLADGSDDEDELAPWDESAPLLSSSTHLRRPESGIMIGYGLGDPRRASMRRASSTSSKVKRLTVSENYNINYPPSVPGTPSLGPSNALDMSFGDIMMRDELARSSESPRRTSVEGDVDYGSPLDGSEFPRRGTVHAEAGGDTCLPTGVLPDMAEGGRAKGPRPRRRRAPWPDLSILEEWSHFEGRTEERHAKRITEPRLINGRLRNVHRGWYRSEEGAPYRFTYFNEDFQSTIHSQTISELVQDSSFKELFMPDPRILSDDEGDGDDTPPPFTLNLHHVPPGRDGDSKVPTRQPSLATSQGNAESRADGATSPKREKEVKVVSPEPSIQDTSEAKYTGSGQPTQTSEAVSGERTQRYGDRPVWWLDVLSPTESEMKVISKAFGIHPLTAEDIMVQEAREKVELFRHYYFVNYRSFDQDVNSDDFLEPVNMYVVVFREGILSFHFSMTPHPANVRRRIRQLKDYIVPSSDWISYAIIDDITDVFVPLIKNIEEEVDDIDDDILRLHTSSDKRLKESREDEKAADDTTVGDTGGDMLVRVGDCRKRVMGLYRLLGNKADVIKGFAKRCNERWEVAPRSEIGLYLGDIQDHIITMTSNLNHYEMILNRAHANYLAQINIRMNERQEKTADVLGKLTVLGTIVLPMNIITGLWGMNVWVPGQQHESDLTWFVAITAGLVFFGLACYWTAKRVYGIM